MMSLFDHCQWAPTTARKIVKITFKSHHLLVQVNENTFFNVKFADSEYVTPDWLPYILRRFLLDAVHSIDIKFEGKQGENYIQRSSSGFQEHQRS